jgi:disulfide bond formation protein DsbB
MMAMAARPSAAPLLLGAASLGALGFAFLAQYGFGLEPCVLCLYQRWPFAAALVLAALALALIRGGRSPAPALALAGLALAGNAGLALYHVGVEQHWWQGTVACTAAATGAMTLEAMKAAILAAPVVRCDEVAWRFLGLSMAGWNVPLSAGLGLFALAAAWATRGRAGRP